MPSIETQRARPCREPAPNSLLADALSMVLLGLVAVGVIGFAYLALQPEGWIGASLDALWEKSPALVWLTAFGAVIAIAVLRRMFIDRRERENNSDLLFYVGAGAGVFFLFKLIATGSL
jgi:hypothetical protein